MPTIEFHANRTIDAAPEVIWGIFTDYQEKHPSILPKRAFSHFTVEAGGQGDGTVMRFDFRVAGTTRHFHQHVAVVEPGRVLEERNIEGPGQTSFNASPG